MKFIMLPILLFQLGLCLSEVRSIRSPIPHEIPPPNEGPLQALYQRLQEKEADLQICLNDLDFQTQRADRCEETLGLARAMCATSERALQNMFSHEEARTEQIQNLYRINHQLRNLVADLQDQLRPFVTEEGMCGQRARDELKKKKKKKEIPEPVLAEDDPKVIGYLNPKLKIEPVVM
jgi:hypothetical protein